MSKIFTPGHRRMGEPLTGSLGLENIAMRGTQLENTEICWVSNLDLGLRCSDWFTRTDEDYKSDAKHKRMTIKDIQDEVVESRMRKLKL